MGQAKREVNIEILVGMFIFIVLIVLGIFTIVLSGGGFLNKTYHYEVVFEEVGGLHEGDGVYLRGKKIGHIKQTMLEMDHVRVFLALEMPMDFRRGYRIEIARTSMLGGKSLKIYGGHPEAPLVDGNAVLRGEKPIDIIHDFYQAVQGLQEMLGSVGDGQGTLGRLISDDALYISLLRMTDEVGQVVEKIGKGKGSIGRLVNEDQAYRDASDLLANLKRIAERINAGEGILGGLLEDDTAVLDHIQAAAASLHETAVQMNSTNGTIGKLLNDPTLYEEGTKLVKDARAALDDLRETAPVSSFGSVVFGAF